LRFQAFGAPRVHNPQFQAAFVVAHWSSTLLGAAAMALSLLGYFVSMVTAFTVLISLWIGIIGASPFTRMRVQPYPLPAAETTDDAADAGAAKSDQASQAAPASAETSKIVKEARVRKRAPLARQREEQNNGVALGYAEAPWNGAAYPPSFTRLP
jgi:hypothetical protein